MRGKRKPFLSHDTKKEAVEVLSNKPLFPWVDLRLICWDHRCHTGFFFFPSLPCTNKVQCMRIWGPVPEVSIGSHEPATVVGWEALYSAGRGLHNLFNSGVGFVSSLKQIKSQGSVT